MKHKINLLVFNAYPRPYGSIISNCPGAGSSSLSTFAPSAVGNWKWLVLEGIDNGDGVGVEDGTCVAFGHEEDVHIKVE